MSPFCPGRKNRSDWGDGSSERSDQRGLGFNLKAERTLVLRTTFLSSALITVGVQSVGQIARYCSLKQRDKNVKRLVPVSAVRSKQVTETRHGTAFPSQYPIPHLVLPSSLANLAVVTKKRDQGKTQEQNL